MSMYGESTDRPQVEPGRSRTKQSFAASSDINNIVKKFLKTGMIEHVNTRSPVYADVSQVVDFREALEQVRVTQEFFSKLPAKVRAEFENDPALFLDYMADAQNAQEAKDRGLVPEDKPPVEPGSSSALRDDVPGPGVQHRGSDGRFESPK